MQIRSGFRLLSGFHKVYVYLFPFLLLSVCFLCGQAYAAASNTFTILHSFSQSGPEAASTPQSYGPLTLSGSVLYGMTPYGGSTTCGDFGCGAIFEISTDGSGFKVLYYFTAGTGGAPGGSLILSGSTLFGMTSYGGRYNYGTIFDINTDGSGYTVLHNFNATVDDGAAPRGSLTLSGSTLYGMAQSGGANNDGIIFSIGTDGSNFQVIHSFSSATEGSLAESSLTLSGSTLFGMTINDGINGYGTLFKIQTDGSGFTVLHSFAASSTDGKFPWGGYLALSGSTLYGMTGSGGTSSHGTVFRINTDGSGYQILHSFSTAMSPTGSVIVSGSALYGMTYYGGSATPAYGTIFQIGTNGTGFQLLHSFTDSTTDGANPSGTPLLSGSTLYAMTTIGGANNVGTVFSLGVTLSAELWQNAIDLGGGWKYLQWFGSFNTNSSPWIYHAQLSWLYPTGTSTNSIWFWDPQWNGSGGWWWTSALVYPWVYSVSDAAWFYFDAADSSPGARWFCDSSGCAEH